MQPTRTVDPATDVTRTPDASASVGRTGTVDTTAPGARPTGVTILAILAAIGGVLGLLAGIFALGIGGAVAASGGALGGLVSVLGIVAIVQGVLALAFAYGAWMLKPWAWTLGIVAFGISLVLAVIGIINGDFTGQILSVVIAVAVLYYLFTPQVKAAFGRAGSTSVPNESRPAPTGRLFDSRHLVGMHPTRP
jgi:hypothetical protein